MEHRSDDTSIKNSLPVSKQSWEFDSSTKLKICSGKNGGSSISCTVSELYLLYSSVKDSIPVGYVGGMARIFFYENNFNLEL